MQQINFYRQRVAINVLAKDIANAREIYDAAEGHAVIGILSAQFSSVDEGVQEVKRWMADVPSISVGLGAGDPAQFYKAAMIAAMVHPAHVNQTFTGSGFAAGALAATGRTDPYQCAGQPDGNAWRRVDLHWRQQQQGDTRACLLRCRRADDAGYGGARGQILSDGRGEVAAGAVRTGEQRGA